MPRRSMRDGLTPATEVPVWARWSEAAAERPWTVGIEEEVMLLDPGSDWSMANRIDDVLAALPPELSSHAAAETHACVLELTNRSPHDRRGGGRRTRAPAAVTRPHGARDTRPARSRRGDAPDGHACRGRPVGRRAVPADQRHDGRARASRADHGPTR